MRRLVVGLAGAAAVALGAVATPPGATAAPPNCTPMYSSPAGDNTQMTASVPDTCYAEGTVLNVNGAQLEVPPPLEAVSMSWMTDETDPSGGGEAWLQRPEGSDLVLGYTVDSPDSFTAGPSASAAAVGNECSDSTYLYNGHKNSAMAYRVNLGNRPSGVSASDWTTEISLAASTWDTGTNACGYATGSSLFNVSLTRGPDLTARAMTSTGGCLKDNLRVVDFGYVPAPNIAQTCHWASWFFGWTTYEADVRLKQSPIWFKYLPASCSGKFELSGVLTHEFGHVLGFGDLDERAHPYLTMSGKATSCTYQDRILGRGDYLGLKAVYGK